jgi:heptosyltransferase-2
VNKRKIIIIKTGFSEVFNETSSSSVCSLGDVLRCSFLLHYYSNDEVLWVSESKAFPLLDKKVELIDCEEFYQLDLNEYDLIINLEKDLKLIEHLKLSENVYGFSFIDNEYIFRTYPEKETYSLSKINEMISSAENQIFQFHLAKLLGEAWKKENYIFQESLKKIETTRVGFNWNVGSKWPDKALDKSIWNNLESQITKDFEVSWQEGFNDLQTYIDWIDSCDTIITLDSLGLHIALALNKNVIALFGPTNSKEVELFDKGEKVHYSQNLHRDSVKLAEFLSKISEALKK